MWAVTWRLSPLITLMAMPSRARFSNRPLRLRLRWIEEHQKAAKDHISLVPAIVVGPRGNAARSKRQNPETFRTLGLEDRVEFGARGVIHRHLHAVAVERGADVQHVRERPLGHEQVASGCSILRHHDGQPAPHEVVRDLVDLGQAAGCQRDALACLDNGRIEGILDTGLKGCIDIGEPAHFVRRAVRRIKHLAQDDGALSQCAGLVGTKNVHAAEILDCIKAPHDHSTLAHRTGARR